MHKKILIALIYLTYSTMSMAVDTPIDHVAIIPWPQSFQRESGSLIITDQSRIVVQDQSLMPLAEIFSREISTCFGMVLATGSGSFSTGDIILGLDKKFQGESYAISVTETATVTGGNYYSVASGTVTLLQALVHSDKKVSIPHMTIADAPAYPFRGALIDLGRKYHSICGIEQVIELCRFYKIRYLQLHLCDDQLFMFPSTAFPDAGKSNKEFARFEPRSQTKIVPYTREELQGLERFASARGVYLVPELDMPGHSGRLVADVPDPFKLPGNGSTVHIARPQTLEALTILLNEVMDIFQSSPYVHIGADEVGLGGLENSEEFGAIRETYGIKTAHELYGKFVSDMCSVVSKRGKKAIVWEEACNAEGPFPLPKDVLVMVWSQGRDPRVLVQQGYSIVNATWTPLYLVRDDKRALEFIFPWSLPLFGREKSDEYTTLVETQRLQGMQMCSWENSESIEIQMLRGRLALVAERAWNTHVTDTFDGFMGRFTRTDAKFERLVHPVSIHVQGYVENDQDFTHPLVVSFVSSNAELTIRYTLDNSMPSDQWKIYDRSITIDKTVHLRVGLFDKQGRQQGYLNGAWFRKKESSQ